MMFGWILVAIFWVPLLAVILRELTSDAAFAVWMWRNNYAGEDYSRLKVADGAAEPEPERALEPSE